MPHFILFIFLLLLAGCATVPSEQHASVASSPVLWENRVGVLSSIQNWDLDALIAVRNQKNSGSANMQWKQSKQNYSIHLFGPMGMQSVQLAGRPGKVSMLAQDGKQVTASSPEVLLAQQTGWRLPVSNLYYWIRGLPVPNQAAQKQFDLNNRLEQLRQAGWTVQYLDYVSTKQIDLPRKIYLSHADILIKIHISRWDF